VAKNSQTSRRAVIDDIRKKQRGTERARGLAIVAVCSVIALAIVVVAAWKPVVGVFETRSNDAKNLADIGQSASAAGCTNYLTIPAEGNQQHVPMTQTVTYTTAPPAFGPHWNVAGIAPVTMTRKFYTTADRPQLEALVHNLEHGYTLLWYDKSVADNAKELNQIRSIGNHFEGTEDWRDKFIAVPWTAADEKATFVAGNAMTQFPEGKHIAFTHWSGGGTGVTDTSKQLGVFQYCSGVSGSALKQFMQDYPYTDAPEPAAM
jgi:hypothetical protein